MFLSAFNDYAVVISFSAIIINTLIFIIMFLIANVTVIVNVSIKFVAIFFVMLMFLLFMLLCPSYFTLISVDKDRNIVLTMPILILVLSLYLGILFGGRINFSFLLINVIN